jgi:hypothetical protein
MPDFDGFPIRVQVQEAKFEVAVYELLRSEPEILVSCLLYYRIPVELAGPRVDIPQDIVGRRLFLFERAEGKNNVWWDLNAEERVCAYVKTPFPSTQSKCSDHLFRAACLLSQLVSVHHCSASISPPILLLLGFANASLNRSLNHSPFPSLLHASFVLLFSGLRSRPQSAI